MIYQMSNYLITRLRNEEKSHSKVATSYYRDIIDTSMQPLICAVSVNLYLIIIQVKRP